MIYSIVRKKVEPTEGTLLLIQKIEIFLEEGN